MPSALTFWMECEMRYDYARGYKNRDAAQDALWEMMSDGEISEGEHPRIEKRGKNYYVITLED